MLEDEDFSREDLEHSEEVEAGVWVDWEVRVVRVHSAVRSVLQTIHDDEQRRQDERVATTLSSMRGLGGTGGVGL